ncbi:tyrosine-type recombinase/integrase [Endosaccharibacter trunci]|uniref:tyrosine-type recombinase/integrase n=1 Tax=Endosaccharibacter trunci TaxID=2812733 RepID=UPI003BF61CF8
MTGKDCSCTSRPAGGRHWRWRCEFAGKEKLLTIGPPAVTLLEARDARDKAKGVLGEGRDPSVEKKLQRASRAGSVTRSFEAVARAWHSKAKPHWTARHADDVIRSPERDVFTQIGGISIDEITPPIGCASV